MIIQGKTVEVGTIIKFQSKNPKETNLLQGTVECILTATKAKIHGDIIKYHQEVLVADPSLNGTPDAYMFMVVKDAQGSDRPFAVEWLLDGSVEIVDTTNIVNINVYGVTDDEAQTILSILRDNRYIAGLG